MHHRELASARAGQRNGYAPQTRSERKPLCPSSPASALLHTWTIVGLLCLYSVPTLGFSPTECAVHNIVQCRKRQFLWTTSVTSKQGKQTREPPSEEMANLQLLCILPSFKVEKFTERHFQLK